MVGRMQKRILAMILALVMVVGQTLTGALTLKASAATTSYETAPGTALSMYVWDFFDDTSVFSSSMAGYSTTSDTSKFNLKYASGTEIVYADGGGDILTSRDVSKIIFSSSATGNYSFTVNRYDWSDTLIDSATVTVAVNTANTAPMASEVSISGTAKVGQTLTGNYTYYDADGNTESGTTFKWYRATDSSGTGAAAISGAEEINYTLTSDDLGKYICFEVTPKDGTDNGTAVKSSYTGLVGNYYTGNWSELADTDWYTSHPTDTSFIITTEAELAGFASIVNTGTDTFLGDTVTLAADLDLAGRQWAPIGHTVTAETIFEGTFDGGSHTISNLTIGTTEIPDTTIRDAGLFGYIQGVTIKDLGLVNVSIYVAYFDIMAGGAGGLAAIIDGYDSITNTVTNCYATGVVSGGGYNNSLGGLIGAAACCTMSGCYSTGSVLGSDNNAHIGGLVGGIYVSDSISDCYSTCDVSAQGTQPYAGGLFGSCTTTSISNCYAAGDVAVEAGDYVGGFLGYREGGNMTNCYYNNSATQTSGGVAQTAKGVGVGTNDATGKTSVYMTSTDFVTDLNNGGTGAWISDTGLTNQGYPVLTALPAAAGPDTWDGSSDTDWYIEKDISFTIYTAEELAGFAVLVNEGKNFADKTVTLAADLDLAGWDWTPIGKDDTNRFSGIFDGGSHTISNLTIGTSGSPNATFGYAGLFGYVDCGTITDVGLIDVSIFSTCSAGGLAGFWNGTNNTATPVTNCYATGSISVAGEYAGGLIGKVDYCTASNCFAAVDVTGGSNTAAGGLFGYTVSKSSATSCYATGNVTASGDVGCAGGLIGLLCDTQVVNCYAAGSTTGVLYAGGLIGYNDSGSITGCYHNSSAGTVKGVGSGTGSTIAKTSDYMKTADFVTDLNTGYTGTWASDTGSTNQGYPVLTAFADDSGSTAPILTAGTVIRTSDTTAIVKFTSDEAGTYYYSVVDDGASAPTINTDGMGISCTAGETTISVSSLTAGAKDIYIKAKDADGNVGDALKIDIAAYVAPELTVGGSGIFTKGNPVIIAAGTSGTLIYYDADADGELDAGETPMAISGPSGNTTTGYDLSGYDIYGTAVRSSVASSKITMLSGTINYIFGGGQNAGVNVTGNTDITVKGGAVAMIYGGGSGGSVSGDINVTVTGGTVLLGIVGGSSSGTVSGDTNITITGGTISSNVYGGGGGGTVSGNANVTLTGGTINGNIYGGGWSGSVTGAATVMVGVDVGITGTVTSGCREAGPTVGAGSKVIYEVAFYSESGGTKYSEESQYRSQWITEGYQATKPNTDPTQTGVTFSGWKKTGDNTTYNFDSTVSAATKLYAGWLGIELGNTTFSGGKYYYTAAEVTGDGIRTILIAFSDNVASGDQIVLPTAPAGFTVSATSNDYTKRINLAEGTSTSAVQDYLRSVGFAVASATQMVSITVTTENITIDTFYNSGTEHYYQFLPAGVSGITWTDAYTAAKNMTYMGRTGYLATVMSLEEDTYLNSLSGGSTGWLGGTILNHGTLNGLYYDSFQTNVFVSDGWYWACGPEIGKKFYNVNNLEGDKSLETLDTENMALGYYFNWGRGSEPNNSAGSENCLTTLKIDTRGKQGTLFSWNDVTYNNTDQSSGFSAKGYFVEYGNLLTGDDGSGNTAFASASDEIVLSTDATLKTSSTVKGETVSLGTPSNTLGSETAGSVSLTPEQAADTSNAGSYITLFEKNDANATVKVVKYTSGASMANFADDAAYANEAVSNGDIFIIRVTAQDGITVNYYRINTTINASLTISGDGIFTNGYPIIIAAGTSGTLIYYDADADGELDAGETPMAISGPSGNTTTGYNLSLYYIYGTAAWSSVASSKITMLGGQVCYIFGSGPADYTYVTGNTDITVKGGTVFMLYGGGNYGSVGGSTNITVTGGTIINGIVGGCGAGTVSGNAKVTITGGTISSNVYGGGWGGCVTGTATVTVGVDAGIAGSVRPGCSVGGTVGAGSKVVYEVAFYGESGGTKYGAESQYPSQWITEGSQATKPATNPTQTGMTFVGWKKVSDNSVYSFNSAVSTATKLYAGFLSADATLKETSTVKGETVALGTPSATLGAETAGSVILTSAQAADTSNTGSYITLFDKNDENAEVKVVKYAKDASTENFETDAAYANEAISNGDFFIVRVTAQDDITVNYYKIRVIVAATTELTDVAWKSGSTYTCGMEMSSSCRMVTISVDSGYFTVPSLGSGVLTYLGGTYGTAYISSYLASQKFESAVFSFADVSEAEALLENILYSLNGGAQQTITATASSASPQAGDIFFEGHFYRYVATPIDWVTAALAAGDTEDPYFGGRGYLATATSQAENSILLKLVDTGETGDDHWNDAWMGGLWQRNTGTVASPSITRGTDGNEISYSDLSDAKTTEQQNLLQSYPILYSGDGTCNGTTSYIYEHPEKVLYYWLDGPEAGQEIANNVTDGFSPWHSGEPNCGDFVYIGWQGAYWDDLSAYNGSNFATQSGYIVEFSGFGEGGSTEGIIASDTKAMDADTTAPGVTDKTITASNITRTGATLSWNKATDDCSAQGTLEYLVYRSTSNNLGTVTDIETNGTPLDSYTADIATKAVTGLTAGTTYYFNVIAKDMAGNKTCYTTESVTTLPPITSAITPASALKEENLNTNSLTVALSNVTFADNVLDQTNFTLNNKPDGVSIESVVYTDATHCTVNLAYDDADFDTDVTSFSLTIKIAELSDNDGNLTSNELSITALVETAPTVTTDSVPTYTATTALLGGSVTASGGESVTEKGVVYSSTDDTPEIGETGVTKNDNGTGIGTFSETTTGLAQGTKYYVRAYATNIEGTSYGAVEEFTTLIITSAITPASALEEENLDTNSLTVELSNVTFADNVLDQANFTLNHAPDGVSIESVVYTDATHCTVNLAYDDADFDTDVTTFSLTIAVEELTEGEDLTSNELTITALVETAPTVTTDSVPTYTATTALLGGSVTASGGESVTEKGVVYSSTDDTPEIGETGVTKNDNGTGIGTFSETTTGLAQGTKYYVRAYATNIEGTSYGAVEEFTTLIITSAITPASALEEENLDTNSLTVALSNVTFADNVLDQANFTLNHAPDGVSIESVVYTDATHCTVNLAYDDADFDTDVTTFSLTIAVEELTEGEDLASNELTITALVEPAPMVALVSPNRGRVSGGTRVTIRGKNFTKVLTVRFGEVDATSYVIVSDTKIVAFSPAGSAGTVYVTVTTKGGTSTENLNDRYTYARMNSNDSGPADETGTHAVTFRDWDGTVLKIQIVEDGKEATLPENPQREGYTFVGWEEVYDESTGNTTLMAKYTANSYADGTYTVSFDSNGGSIVESQSIPYGGNVREPDDPVRDGYTFGGWYTDDGLSRNYNFSAAVTGNLTLYAKWFGNGATALPLETEFSFAPGDSWECVTTNFTVRGISSEGIQITWVSSDPDVIRMEQGDDGMIGIVTRPQDHDASVVLTVTATEGNQTVSMTSLLIVRREGVSREETYAETERTASAQVGNSVGSEPIYRSTLDDGTKIDSIILTADTVRKLVEQGGVSDSVVVTIGDFAADPANEYTFEAPLEAITALSQNGLGLTLASPAGTIAIPAEEVERAAQSGTLICFRIAQATGETEEAEAAFLGDTSVFSAPDMTGKVFGVPKRIETNMEDLRATVTLPVKGLSEEQTADEAFLQTLCVYVEHESGSTELAEGTLVYADNVPVGIRFEIDGFSRFQVVSVEGAAAEAETEAPSPWIWIAYSAAGLAVLVAVFLLAVRRKKESHEDARS